MQSVTGSDFMGMDLFTGAGGLSYGLSRAGFNMSLGIEANPNCAKTLSKNQPIMKILVSDIRSVEPAKVMRYLNMKKGDLTIMTGGPPCRGFSESNKRTRSLKNPLNHLYKDFFRFVKDLRPAIFLLENVQGLRTLHHGAVLQDILRIGEKCGYHIHWSVVNAEDYGVPQRRKRIFFVGALVKINSPFSIEKSKITTVREAIDDLPVLENGNRTNLMDYSRNNTLSEFQKVMRRNDGKRVSNNLVTKNNSLVLERYEYVPQGGNWSNIPIDLMYNYKNLNNCHRWIYHRLKWDAPSVSISNFRKNMLIHPTQNRGLSVREAARLQTFPDNYEFYGPLGSQQQQVANAVPPLLAQKIGENIIDCVADG